MLDSAFEMVLARRANETEGQCLTADKLCTPSRHTVAQIRHNVADKCRLHREVIELIPIRNEDLRSVRATWMIDVSRG